MLFSLFFHLFIIFYFTANSQIQLALTFASNVTKISAFGTLDNAQKAITYIEQAFYGERTWSNTISPTAKSILNPVPVSNLLIDTFFKDGTSFITDPRVYNKHWWNEIKDNASKRADRQLKTKRTALKEEIIDFYYNKFSEELPNESKSKRRRMAEKAADREIRRHYSKDDGESSAELMNRIDFKEERDIWGEGQADYDLDWHDLEDDE